MARRIPAAAIACALLLGVCGVARAEITEEQREALRAAKEHVPEGQAMFKDGEYEAALKHFREAERILEEAELDIPPSLERILGRCYDQLGQVVPALRYLNRFLTAADSDDPETADAVRRAEQAVARLQGQLTRTKLSFDVQPAGTQVRIGARSLGETPLEPVQVSPGPQQVTLWKDGFEPHSVDVQVVAGTTVPIVVRLAKAPLVAASEDDDGISWWVVGGAAAAAVTVAAVTVVLLSDDEAAATTTPTPAPIPFRTVQ